MLPQRTDFYLSFTMVLLIVAGTNGYGEETGSEPARFARPTLQIINGSDQPVDIFWLKSDIERVPSGSVEAGKQTSISTTLGHRFELAGRNDKATAQVTSQVTYQGFLFDPAGRDGVPSFYEQVIHAHGFPIAASAKVNPYALKEAAYLIDLMLSQRPDVRKAMIKSGARLCIMAYDEYTTDLPEFRQLADEKVPGFESLDGKDYWDARARGLGGSETDPFCSVGEENLLAYPGDPYQLENILIHEFAHNIHLRGMVNVDPTFDRRLKTTYEAAMKAGLWAGKYAATNHHEYFAEGVQSWFDNNRPPDHDHNHVNTRELLVEYDPGLAAICREVFGETELKYSKPTTRLTGHMQGYDPAKAPTFVWPKRLKHAQTEIRNQAVARSKTSPDSQEIQRIAGWTVHVDPKLLQPESVEATNKAIKLLKQQLEEITRIVPEQPVADLKRVPLWLSAEYPNKGPTAEYHPGVQWLIDNHRNPEMARAVEFTNTRIFEAETRRMPNFVLHELAHAYHDRVLPNGYDNAQVKHAYERAKAAGTYDRVERQDSEGRRSLDKAYAMSNPMEYFAESTEAFFGRNDFFPFNREDLQKHDPEMFALLKEIWMIDAGTGPAKQANAANESLNAFFKAYLEADFQLSPLRASRLGDHRFDNLMDDVSSKARQRRFELTQRTLQRLPLEVPYEKLSRGSQVDYEILRDSLKLDLWLEETEKPFEHDPRLYTSLVTEGVYMLLSQSTQDKEASITNAIARMKLMPQVLAAAKQNLQQPIRVVTETAIRQNKGAIGFYESELFQMVGESPQKEAVKAAAAPVIDALKKHQQFLETELLPKATQDWRLGKERFAKKLEMVLDAGFTAEQALQHAETNLIRVQNEMYLVARQLWGRYFPRQPLPPDDEAGRRAAIQLVIEEIGRDRSTAEQLTNDARATVSQLNQFIQKRNLLKLPDPDRCEIIEMPEFQRGNSVAFLEPAPPLDTTAPSIYAISPPPRDWDAARVASFLSEYNRQMLKILTIHEAYPGHYVQLEYANRHPSLIRRVLGSGVYAEGWANYCEQMMLDQGYGDGDLALRMMQLKFLLRSVANTILDHNMHCTQMSDEEAVRFLTEDAFQGEGEARLKVIRSKQSSCQLSTYFIGRTAFMNLRASVQREMGDRFELGRYHEAVMNEASVPVKYLPELVRAALKN